MASWSWEPSLSGCLSQNFHSLEEQRRGCVWMGKAKLCTSEREGRLREAGMNGHRPCQICTAWLRWVLEKISWVLVWTDPRNRMPRATVECLSLEAGAAWVTLLPDSASPDAQGDLSRCVLTQWPLDLCGAWGARAGWARQGTSKVQLWRVGCFNEHTRNSGET